MITYEKIHKIYFCAWWGFPQLLFRLVLLCQWLIQEWTTCPTLRCVLNSLAPGRFQRNFSKVIFQLILVIDGWSISCKIVLKWMPTDLTDRKSTLVQVMAWCRQATSHYLSQCWPRSLLPYGVVRPQWVNSSSSGQNGRHLADYIFRCISLNEKFCVLIQIALNFVPKGSIYNKPALV